MVSNILMVALGGAVGASARYLAMAAIGRRLGDGFPYGTLAVNVLGSLAMGLLVGALARFLPENSHEIRTFVAVGVLGSFTTFSTFSLDVVTLIERGQISAALGYIALSLVACVAGLAIGLFAWRMLPV
ncbi:MAG: fluoride efflux transporter CrcB [Rickettsiales bacterium]